PLPPRPELSPDSKRRRQYFFLSLGSLLLFGLGATGVWFAVGEFQRRSVTQVEGVPENRFISASSMEKVDATGSTRDELVSAIALAGAASTPREPTHIYIERTTDGSTKTLSSSEFLNILESHAPGNLTRSFEDPFMIGSLGQSRFIIFRLASYEHSFAG